MPAIEGLRYVAAYLDEEEHDRLLAAVDEQPWQTSVDHGVQIYGYRYNHRSRAVLSIGGLPPWAIDLAVRLQRDGLVATLPDQMVANEYHPGSGLFAHVDQSVFGDTVASVSLGSTCVMRFSNGADGRTEELLLEPRSALILTGEARWAWTHEIPARSVDVWRNQNKPRSRRVSLTFRTVMASDVG